MIPYNTNLDKLVLPEFGRLVQEMIKVCQEIEDKEQRNLLAASIVETMKAMTQEKGQYPDDRKFWDYLFLISGNTLDIDSPYGKPEEAAINPKPERLSYNSPDFGMRHYGQVLQRMVKQVALMPNSEDKDACVELLANHVKKLLVMNNTENAYDERVYADLDEISGGSINVKEGVFDLPEFKEEKPVKGQKRKKNR